MDLSGVGVWGAQLGYGDQGEAAEAAAELEELGFGALWIPDAGLDALSATERLLAATERVVVATGVLNLWNHVPAEVAAKHAALTAAHGDRFLLGIGVSHAPVVDAAEAGRYRRPLAAMRTFLDGLDAAESPVRPDQRVLAALGPKMLDLAATRTRGVHPYLVTPEHTALARQAVGPAAVVAPEVTVALCATREQARELGDNWLCMYFGLPNYVNNVLRLGFTEQDVATVSDRVFDALIAWGDEAAIRRRVDEHRAAGADQVAIQVLTADGLAFPRDQWRRLAAALV